MKKITLAILVAALLSLALAGCQNDLVGGGGKSPFEGTWATSIDPTYAQIIFTGDKFEWRRSDGRRVGGTFEYDYGVIYWTRTWDSDGPFHQVYNQEYEIVDDVLILKRNGDHYSGRYVKIK